MYIYIYTRIHTHTHAITRRTHRQTETQTTRALTTHAHAGTLLSAIFAACFQACRSLAASRYGLHKHYQSFRVLLSQVFMVRYCAGRAAGLGVGGCRVHFRREAIGEVSRSDVILDHIGKIASAFFPNLIPIMPDATVAAKIPKIMSRETDWDKGQ